MGDSVNCSHNGGHDVGASSSRGSKSPSNMFPQMLQNLLDAIYSFASMKGLRSGHCIQSTEVVDSVWLMFGNLVLNAREEVQKEFELHNERFGGWKAKLLRAKSCLCLSSRVCILRRGKMVLRRWTILWWPKNWYMYILKKQTVTFLTVHQYSLSKLQQLVNILQVNIFEWSLFSIINT